MMIKTFSHEVRSREEFEMIKITKQVQQDVAESGMQRGDISFTVWERPWTLWALRY